MAGHIQDRWYQPTRDPKTGKVLYDDNGKELREPSKLYGVGDRYKVRYYDAASKERSKSFPDKQLRRARIFLAKMQHDVLAGTYIDPEAGKVKFQPYSQEVMQGWSRDISGSATVRRKFNTQVYPIFGELPLEGIGVDTIRSWLSWMSGQKRPLSESYQMALYDMVSSVLEAAKSERRIASNPCRDKSINRPRARPRPVVPWARTKMSAIETALPKRQKIVIPLGSGLGLRQGEVLAFSLDNVDRDNMLYRCTRQLVYVNKQLMWKLPKHHKTRDIPLGNGILQALDAYAETYPPVSITLPWAEQDGRTVETIRVLRTNDSGGLDIPQTFNNTVWRPAFAAAGLIYDDNGGDGMHALRHLYASLMLSLGVSIKELAAFLGHSSEAFTLRTYVHLMPNSYDRARLAINSMFTPAEPTDTPGDRAA